MATPSNLLSAVVPKLLAQGLMSLREISIMPRLVNSGYSTMAGEKGSTIDIPIPSAIVASAVDHANVAPNPGALAPTSVALSLDQWFEAAFTLSDKEMLEVQAGTIPMQASAAIRALANNVDNYIFSLWSRIPFHVKATTDGTPFNPTTVSASDARTIGMTDVANIMTALNAQLAPMEDRRVIVDPIAYGNLVQMRAFQDVGWSGSVQTILEGKINHKLGFDWWMTQNLPISYTSGAGVTGGDTVAQVAADAAAGASSVSVALATEALALKKGDIISFSAAGAGFYVVTQDVTQSSTTGNVTINIYPPLRVALGDATPGPADTLTYPVTNLGPALGANEAFKVCLAFQRDAIAFATRPLSSVVDSGLGSIISSAVDPISGLALRLEVTREFRRTRFAFDILYGAQLIRPEFAVRYQY